MYAWGMEPPQAVAPLALAAAERAIQLDSTLAEPWATIGYYKTIFELDWAGAEAAFLESLALNANYGTAHHWYAFYLSTIGKADAAVDEILKAREAEPLSPVINGEVGLFLVYDGQYERTIEELYSAGLWNPDFPSLLISLARAHAMLGNTERASEMVDRMGPYSEADYLAQGFLTVVLPRIGRGDETRMLYAKLFADSESRYIMPSILGLVAASLGDYDAAFSHSDEALQQHSLIASWLRDPLIADIRDDPRYGALFQRIGLEP